MSSAHEHICSEMINVVHDLTNDITEKEDVLNSHNLSVKQKVEFDEDELVAEPEKLERSQDENLFEEDGDVSHPVLLAASASHPAKMEDEDEDDLEYLRRWAEESLLEKNLNGTEDRVFSSPVLSTSLSSHPAELEDDEDEDELENLRRWVAECL
ncbi:charged multivesicular body protein 4c [Austrofundulus limnaeus]|uniref:Charged multivesicular body protein 4c n=1 Tax=Austrofundulus limnaeus TaxID=52670 RepID=A0A2I4DAD9_AUSLI|nr:PREDICTED: charged multivesicular body protein 4c-like [Austrofundulus limnaeus]